MRIEVQDPLPFPDHLDIELTNACNLRCLMCPRSQMTRAVGYMSKDTLNRVLVDAVGRVKTTYLHQMGEPLLHPHLFEFIALAKNSGLWTSLSTNAFLLTGEKATGLIESPLDHIVIAYDSMRKALYERIRAGASFAISTMNIEEFLKLRRDAGHGPQVDVQMVVMDENKDEVEEYATHFQSLVEGFGRVMFSPVVDWAGTVNIHQDKSAPFVCTMLNYSLTVQWDGNVCVCCRDFNGSTSLGNVHDKPLQELWHTERMGGWRRAVRTGDIENMPKFCRGCFQ